MTKNKRSEWNSNLTFVMAMIGSAVGLGNIWRFPNTLYSNGGGSFMIPYIISVFLLGISFVLIEYAVGFKFKKSLSKILYSINKKFEPVAWFVLTVVFLITTYYICIVGWDLIYLVLSFTKAWGSNPDLYFTQSVLHATDSIDGIFTIVPNILISIIVIWAAIWTILKRDLNAGIGRANRILLPLLCIIVVIFVGYTVTLPGASIGYSQIFTPDWSALTNSDVWLSAFGQIVFSLSLGMAIALTYASYLPEGSKLVDNALVVAFSNSGFEVFNSIGIFSVLGFMALTSGLPFNELVTEGTGLAFVVFPQALNLMHTGGIIGPLFFLCILFAGITSAIALLEGVCYSLSEKFDWSREKSVTIVTIIGVLITSVFATASGSFILGIFDAFLNNFALLFAVLLECIIFGWIYDFDELMKTLNENSRLQVHGIWKIIIKCILPICIFCLWAQGIYTTLKESDPTSIAIRIILLAVIIILPIVLSKLPAKNKDFCEEN